MRMTVTAVQGRSTDTAPIEGSAVDTCESTGRSSLSRLNYRGLLAALAVCLGSARSYASSKRTSTNRMMSGFPWSSWSACVGAFVLGVIAAESAALVPSDAVHNRVSRRPWPRSRRDTTSTSKRGWICKRSGR